MKNNFFKKIANAFERYQTKRAAWMLRNQTFRELSKLSDHELDDIGLNRGSIRGVAMEAYYDNR